MYKGTVIRDLMAMVQRAEMRAEQQRVADEEELRGIFSMRIPVPESDRVFMGAA
jgi:hypothetical protein